MEARLAVVGQKAAPIRPAADALQGLRHAIENVHQPALVKPPLAELEGERDQAIAAMILELGRVGLDAQVRLRGCLCTGACGLCRCNVAGMQWCANQCSRGGRWRRGECGCRLTSSLPPQLIAPVGPPSSQPQPATGAAGAAPGSGGMTVREMVRQLIEEARRLPEVPPMPVDYSGLLDSIRRWIEELQGAAADVEQAQAVRAACCMRLLQSWMACMCLLLCNC